MPPLSPFNRTCLALAIGQAVALPAHGATIEVNSGQDDGDGVNCTLREAIVSVNNLAFQTGCVNSSSASLGTDDTIMFNATSLAPNGGTITLTQDEKLYVRNDVVILGPGRDLLTIERSDPLRGGFALDGSYGMVSASISGLTISGSREALSVFGYSSTLAQVSISDCRLVNNKTTQSGAAITVGKDASVTVEECEISRNTANRYGGAISVTYGTLTITNSILEDNIANATQIAGGGAIYVTSGGTATISESTISGNYSGFAGGGIHVSGGTLVVENSTISNNSVYNSDGSEGKGGGIMASGSIVSIASSSLFGNSAKYAGGGIYGRSTSEIGLLNSTLSGNIAGASGAAAWSGPTSTIMLDSSTVAANTAPFGALFAGKGGTLDLKNSLVADTAGGGEDCRLGTGIPNTFIDSGGNLIETTNISFPCTLISGITDEDPYLGTLKNNGGVTLTHGLREGSPALNAIVDSQCQLTDQTGKDRSVDDGFCDIGAFEGLEIVEIEEGQCYVVNGQQSETIVFCL